YKPVAFEREATGRFPESWPDPLSGVAIRGRMDRIDYQPEERRYRVIDYKLKLGKSRAEPDKDLLRAALRGQRLQPPLYLLLGKEAVLPAGAETRGATVDAAFYFLAPRWPEGTLVVERLAAGAWENETGRSLVETVASIAAAIRSGLFFVQPGEHCRYCEVSEACRRNHRPTMWRIEKDARSRSHAEIKQKRVPS
ncbi:MAG TPA: PD-(D/E)XK nuclease family protein, partial [Vicinamibacteria bacterium]